MTETEAWRLAGDLLLDSPLKDTAWRLAREELAQRIVDDAAAVQEMFDAAADRLQPAGMGRLREGPPM